MNDALRGGRLTIQWRIRMMDDGRKKVQKLYGDRLEEQIWIHRCLECRGQVKQLEDPEIQDGPARGPFHKRRSHTMHSKGNSACCQAALRGSWRKDLEVIMC